MSADGSRLVAIYADRTARVWNIQTGEEIATLRTRVLDVSFSNGGSRVVTASDDGSAQIWNAQTGEEIFALKGHSDFVLDASFSADDSRVVTASGDGTARIWNAQTGEEIATLKGHTDGLLAAWFSADGYRVATVSADGTARSWANSDNYPSFLQSRIRARTWLCLDASFRQSTLGESATEAERNVWACEQCVPVFFERIRDAPVWKWQIYEESLRGYQECLGRETQTSLASYELGGL